MVTIVDYGVGNLHSVKRAFEQVTGNVQVTSDAKEIIQAERLVLPGVGAFGHCMDELEKRGLTEAILEFAESGRPFLGICAGMQIMLSMGEEFGEHKGLGLISGRVQKMKASILPSIGWMELKKTRDWQGTIFNDTAEGSSVYFVHSFAAQPEDASVRLAEYEYDGVNITAAISKNNLTGVQFHPEKSGLVGMNMLKGWHRAFSFSSTLR
jgi:imidazole glycerol-phosphate synthase subunit HisH